MVNVSIYVSNGSMSSPYYTFYTDAAGTQELTPPNSLYLNNTYTFYRLNDAVNHPFYISDVGYEQASTVVTITGDGNPLSGIIHTQSIVVEFNSLDANDSLYYFCTSHSNMIGTFTLLVPPVPAAIFNKFVQFNDDVEISGNVTLNGVMTTTDKVGIGKETPSVALDVSGTIESTSDLVIHGDISGSGANLRNIPNSALVNHTISINSQSVELGNNLDIIASQWTTNGQHIHYNTGNIGIGKTDPSVALDVSGTIESTSDLVIHGDISGSGANLRNIPNSALVNHTISINSQSVELGNNLDIIASQWTTNGQHIHYNTGNIGIGKTDPSVALDVSGTIESTSDLVIHGDISGSGANLRNIPNSALVNHSMIINGQEVQLGTSMELVASQWVTNVNDIYYTSGNIGIQKTNPAYSLDVSGSINCSQLLVNGSEPSFGGGGGGEGSIFVIHDDDFSESLPDYKTGINNSITENIGWVQDLTNNLTYVSGNVGIGIVEPSYNLDISGTVNCLELLVDGVAPLFGSGGGDNILLDASYTTGSESLVDPPQTQRFDTNKFWVLDENDNISFTLNSGNVGIGTTSPTALLHLQSTEGVTLMLEADSDNTNEDDLPLIHMKQDQQLVFHTIGGTNQNDFKFETGTTNGGITNYMAFFTGGGSGPNSGTERLRISGDGNVGIGTTTPSHTLDISGNARMNQLIIGDELDTTGNVSLVIKDNGTGNGHGNATSAGGIRIVSTAAQQSGSVDLLMGVNHASKYSFLQSTEYAIGHQNLILQPVGGNVGIGTTTPTEMLSVRGSILCLGEGNGLIFERNSGTFDNDTTHRRFIMDMVDRGSGYGNTLNISYVGTSTGTATGPNYGGTPTVAMTIAQTDGKVGIGTTTPTHQLDVNGALKLQSIPGNVSQGYEAIRFARNDGDIRYSSIYASAYHVSFNVHDSGPSPHTGEIEVMRLTTDRLTSPSTKGRVGIGTTDPIYTLDVSGEISSSEHLVKNGTYTVKHHRSDNITVYPNLFERTTYDAETVLSNKDTFIYIKFSTSDKLFTHAIQPYPNQESNYLEFRLYDLDGNRPTDTDFGGQHSVVTMTTYSQYTNTDGDFTTRNIKIQKDYVIGDSTTTQFTPQLSIASGSSDGNVVGIGLNVSGTGYTHRTLTTGSLYYKQMTSSTWGIQGYLGLAVTDPAANAADKYGITDGELEAQTHLVITNNGNVGIGTTSPSSAKLTVRKDGLNQVMQTWIGDLGTNNGRTLHILSPDTDSADAPFKFTTGNAITFRIDSIEALNINAAGNVGIGTTSPSETLDVKGTIFSGNAGNTTNIPGLKIRQRVASTGNDGSDYIQCGEFGDIGNNSSGTDGNKFIVKNNGNVGIGTTSPSETLDVYGSFNLGQHGNIKSESYTSSNWNSVAINSNASAGKWSIARFGREGRCNIWFYPETVDGVDVSRFYLKVRENGPNVIQVGGNLRAGSNGEDIMFTGGGNVGIGTTSPSEKLTINGSGSATVPCLGLRNGNAFNVTNDGAQIAFGWNGNNQYQHFIQTRHNGNTASDNAIDFYVCDLTQYNTVTSGSTHTMSLNQGRVGIGTTSPQEKLHVVSDSTHLFLEGATNNDVKIQSCPGPNFRTTGKHEICFGHYVSYANRGHENYIDFKVNDGLQTSPPLRMRINGNGNVGIGTNAPESLLHLKQGSITDTKTIFTTQTQFSTSNTSFFKIIENKHGTGTDWTNYSLKLQRTVDVTTQGYIEFGPEDEGYGIALGTGTTEIMRLTQDGYLGIGTTNPEEVLHVNGNIRVHGDIFGPLHNSIEIQGRGNGNDTNGNVEGLILKNIKSDTGTPVTTSQIDVAYNGLYFHTNETERMRITSAGNVGIGTDSPQEKLSVLGTVMAAGSEAFVLERNSTTFNDANTPRRWTIGMDPSTDTNATPWPRYMDWFNLTYYTTNGTNIRALTITTGGGVGIGTTVPTEKLHVNGVARATSFTSTSDDRVKHNETPLTDSLGLISQLHPKRYLKTQQMYDASLNITIDASGNYTDISENDVVTEEIGIIAQDVLSIDDLSFLVKPSLDPSGNETGPMGLDYQSLFVLSIQAIQELKARIETLEAQVL